MSKLAADESVLLTWTTDTHLKLAMGVIESWGFEYKTVGFTWVKSNAKIPGLFMGMGALDTRDPRDVLAGNEGETKAPCC
jgi:N6-adenosine-specific RNA methylase IME4